MSPSQRVLVTGANGFIACHIINQLIEAEISVVGTVRSEAKQHEVLTANPSWREKVSFIIVEDILAAAAFDEAFNTQLDFVIHAASPVSFSVKDIQKDLIDPAVRGTLGVLESAHERGGRKFKRVVLLGSAVSILDSFDDLTSRGSDYTEDNWNPVSAKDAIEQNNMVYGYNASKAMSERSAWQFMTDNNPTFDLVVLNPDVVIGPMLHPVPQSRSINETNRFAIYDFLDGTNKTIESVRFPFYHFIDVRDVAKAHLLALTAEKASGKRIILVSGLLSPQLVANILRTRFPELRNRVAEGRPDQILPPGLNPTGWDISRARDIFGKGWRCRTLEESVVDALGDILQEERQWATK